MPATTRKKADSKLQAKLGFTPVSKDSAQAQELSPSVRSRASAVRYFSPKKPGSILETRTSSRHRLDRPSTRSTRIKQQKLQLTSGLSRSSARLAQSEEEEDDEDDHQFHVSQRRSSPVASKGLPLSSGRGLRSSPGVIANDIELSTGRIKTLRNGLRSKAPGSSPPVTNTLDDDDNTDSESDLLLPPVGTRRRPQILEDDDEDGETENEDANESSLPPIRDSTSRHHRMNESDDSLEVLPHKTRHSRTAVGRTSNHDSGRLRNGTDNEDELIISSSTRRSRHSRVINSDQEDSDEDDEEEPIVVNSARATKRFLDNSDEDVINSSSPTKKRRLQQGPKPRRTTREEQDEEVFEDAADLQDTTTLSEGLRSASKLNEKKLARQRQLNKLLKRRNKNAAAPVSPSASASASPEPEYTGPYNDGYSDENSSAADSIINDDDLSDDASETSEIRINRCIYSIPSALYYVIRHIVYNKFLPPSSTTTADNAYYKAAHSLLSKRLESHRNQYLSSVWRRPFIASLYARPLLTWPSDSIPLWESCEACGRRDRPATYVIRFEGSCYEENTLKPIPDSESEVWAKYDEIVDQQRVWHVGSDCHDNAWRAHRAAHWRFGLAGQVDKVLGMMGVRVPVPVPSNSEVQSKSKSEAQSRSDSEAPSESEHDVSGMVGMMSEQELEDKSQAVLLQMEEQGYMRALQDEFMERFEMEAESESD